MSLIKEQGIEIGTLTLENAVQINQVDYFNFKEYLR
jgi:hypothetical protein